jgi:hypothetical protein
MTRLWLTVWQLIKHIDALKKDWEIDDNTLLISSIDDEGNAYHAVYFAPEVLYFDKECKWQLDAEDQNLEGKETPFKYLWIN